MKPTILNKACDVIRPRITRLFLLTAFFCAVVITLIWVFMLFDELSVRIFMSLVVAMVPALEFQSSPKTWESREELAWFASFLMLTLLIVMGDKLDWQGVAMNAVILLVALPYGWLVWKLMRRNWLLLTGLMLALAVMMIYWMAALVVNDETLSILLPAGASGDLWRHCMDAGGVASVGNSPKLEEPKGRRPRHASACYGHPVPAGCSRRRNCSWDA